MRRVERDGFRSGRDGKQVAAACGDGGDKTDAEHPSGLDLTGEWHATRWPDSDELLLIGIIDDLATYLRAGFRRLNADHLQVPWNDLVTLSLEDEHITLAISASGTAAIVIPDATWRTATTCLIGVMLPVGDTKDCPAAEQFLAALDEGSAALAETGIRVLRGGGG